MTLGDWILDLRNKNSIENDDYFIIKERFLACETTRLEGIDMRMWCLIV